jgi:hypothetical protein
LTVCEICFKLKFSKFILNIRTLIVFGKFLLIVLFIHIPNIFWDWDLNLGCKELGF